MTADRLFALLRRTSRLTLLAQVARAACAVVGLLLAAGLAAVLFDAVMSLQPWGLIAVDVLLLALVVAGTAYVSLQAARHWFDARRTARLLEERLGITDSRLINAVELAADARANSSRELIDRSLQQGDALAAELSPRAALPLRPLARAAAACAAIVALVVLGYFTSPRMYARVIPRFLDPTGDHPPYTPLDFAVTISPETVYHGRPAEIAVAITGPDLPEAANLVFVAGEAREAQPMLLAADGRYLWTIDRADATREFFIDTPKGRSGRMTFAVEAVPLFESVKIVYHFPSYTDWPPTSHPLDARGIRSLEGTEVVVTVESSLPLKHALLELFNGEESALSERVTLAPLSNQPATAQGKFTLTHNGTFRLSLLGANGAAGLEPLSGKLVCAPDDLPRIEFIEPAAHVVAVEDWKVPLTVQAADDIALGRLALFCGVNGWGPDETALTLEPVQRNIVRGHYEFDLAALGARAGDVITYYASAYDTHPGGEHFTDTPTQVIEVISLEEYVEYARTQYRLEQIREELAGFQQQLEGLRKKRDELLAEAEGLKKKLESGEQLTSEEQQQLEDLQQKLEEFARQAEQLSRQMAERAEQPRLYDFEEQYQETLKKLSEQLAEQEQLAQQAVEKAESLREQPESEQARQELQEALEKLGEESAPFDEESQQALEQAAQDQALLQKADAMQAQGERFQAVVRQQRELADRLGQFREQSQLSEADQKRINRLAKEQELLQQELTDLTQAMRKAAEEAQQDLPETAQQCQGLCDAIEEQQIGQDQGQAARAARAGEGQQAHASAEQAAEKLESLLSQCGNCEGMANEMSGQGQGRGQGAGQRPGQGRGQGPGGLDGGLRLSRDQLRNSLEQLSQGRGIPGMGEKGQNGQQGQAGQAGQQPGQAGEGQSGSEARSVVMGPHMRPSGQENRLAGQAAGEDGPGGRGGVGGGNDALGAETLDPGSGDGRATTAGNLRGVPVGYREQAEAYFRRLAEGD